VELGGRYNLAFCFLRLSGPDDALSHQHLDAFRRLYTTPDDASDSNPDPHLTVIERLTRATVIVVGLGGVGSWAAEALCRSGVGNLVLIDLDDICISNTNRQIHALSSTVGKMKIEEMKRRLLDINPQCNVTLIHDFVGPDNVQDILLGLSGVSACLDAIDGARGKTSLIVACADLQIPIVTCGGSAGRTDPTKFVYDDLTRVQNDKLLAACRKDLRKDYGFKAGHSFGELQRGAKAPRKWRIPAVYSTEVPKIVPQETNGSSMRRCDGALGTACFVTGTAGFIAAGLIVDMIAKDQLKAPKRHRR
jgi:tRNA A37 threonylcarbamoyladenosine dehydratase